MIRSTQARTPSSTVLAVVEHEQRVAPASEATSACRPTWSAARDADRLGDRRGDRRRVGHVDQVHEPHARRGGRATRPATLSASRVLPDRRPDRSRSPCGAPASAVRQRPLRSPADERRHRQRQPARPDLTSAGTPRRAGPGCADRGAAACAASRDVALDGARRDEHARRRSARSSGAGHQGEDLGLPCRQLGPVPDPRSSRRSVWRARVPGTDPISVRARMCRPGRPARRPVADPEPRSRDHDHTGNRPANGVDTATLFATLDAVNGDAEHRQVPVPGDNTWRQRHRTTVDDPRVLRRGRRTPTPGAVRVRRRPPAVLVGTDQGPTPVEFLLHAIAACLTAGWRTSPPPAGHAAAGLLDRRGANIDLSASSAVRPRSATAIGRSGSGSRSTVTPRPGAGGAGGAVPRPLRRLRRARQRAKPTSGSTAPPRIIGGPSTRRPALGNRRPERRHNMSAPDASHRSPWVIARTAWGRRRRRRAASPCASTALLLAPRVACGCWSWTARPRARNPGDRHALMRAGVLQLSRWGVVGTV
jgi:hypothetical protein